MLDQNLNIQGNYPLKNLTTMKVGGPAKYYFEADTAEAVRDGIEWAKEKGMEILVWGGGSNMIVSEQGFPGLVMNINIKGWEVIGEDEKGVKLKVGAGEIWDEIVERAVNNGWWGIENMSKIPGRAGAFVVQNVGAYGQECSEVTEKVVVLEKQGGEIKELNKEQCGFDYRQSIFNSLARGQYIVLYIILKLKKQGEAAVNYPDVIKYLAEKNIQTPNLKQMREVISYIRDNKLPDPNYIPSAGSFFKNLVLGETEYQQLAEKVRNNFGEEVVSKLEELRNKFSRGGEIKIPTGFLIEVCGLKGQQAGGVKVFEKQGLILVNENGKASADDVMNLFKKVRQTVFRKTGMKIVPEPELVGFNEKEMAEYFAL